MTKHLQLLVWRDPSVTRDAFAEALVDLAARQLDDRTGRVRQLNVADVAVDAASGLRQRSLDPQPEAMLGIDVGAVDDHIDVEASLAHLAGIGRVASYLIHTREPVADTSTTPETNGRTPGFSQVALLRRAPEMSTETFRSRWLDHHTGVATATQSTFRYVQHVVDRPLTDGAPQFDGIVEECFPAAAMSDPHVFFATGGDPAVLTERLTTMVDSVSSFLDLDALDVIPTSEFRFDRA